VLSKINNEQRIPSLDGWRAIAISLVLYRHLEYTNPSAWSKVVFDWGGLGVFVFFVISGYLITFLLKRERERTDSVSLKGFYIRRVFRIFPPLLFFLGGVGILARLGLADASTRSILFSLGFLRNFVPGPYRILHHLWSLSVEEQFYLMWPFIFSRLSKRNACRLLLAVILAEPVIRVIMIRWLGRTGTWFWETETIADGLAYGCLLAIMQTELRANRLYQWFSRSYACLILPFIMIAGAHAYPAVVYHGLGKSAIFLSVALAIDITILRFDSLAGKILNSAPLAAIGKLSYSLYLWQQVFLLARDQPYAWFPLNLGLALLASVVSYYFIEQPAIRFGRELARRRTQTRVLTAAAAASQ
jgi:peptidoglycan/LPS O-acetylase OafA/YrhL